MTARQDILNCARLTQVICFVLVFAAGLDALQASSDGIAEDASPESASKQESVQKASSDTATRRPTILAHYMPWYTAPPDNTAWGWHWTMNHFDPEVIRNEKRQIASHFYPLIGPYDSGNPHVIECHLLLMHLAGIDGVIVDWYGLTDLHDYATLHHNTQTLVDQVEKLKMTFVICYEDQTIPALVTAGRLDASQRIQHAVNELKWLKDQWFRRRGYLKREGSPILLSFGHAGLTNEEWSACLETADFQVQYFSEHFRRDAAVGAFDWPVPNAGLDQVQHFEELSKSWSAAIPVIFPRFVDIYAQAEVGSSYGSIPDERGKTLRNTIQSALKGGAQTVQIATWNDWGEGTQIEPSVEHGFRDLEILQKMTSELFNQPPAALPADLRLPIQLLQLRRTHAGTAEDLDAISELLMKKQMTEARNAIRQLENQR